MDEQNYKAEIEYLKDKMNEMEEYYKNIIEQKDDEISDLQRDIRELESRY